MEMDPAARKEGGELEEEKDDDVEEEEGEFGWRASRQGNLQSIQELCCIDQGDKVLLHVAIEAGVQ